MNHVSLVILCVGAVALAGCLAWPKAGVVRTWTPSPQTAVVYSGATAEAIASTVTARPTVTRAVPISTPTPRPSPSPMPSPTNDPHRIMITEVDIEQAMASGTGSGESYVVQGLDVRFSNGKMRLKADQLTYGAFSVKSLDLVGRLVANSGQLQLIAESVKPGGLVGALIPRVANQALAQYASQWYVEMVTIHDGSIELRIR